MNWETIGTIIGAVFGSQVLTTVAQGFLSKKKTDADAASTLVESMLKWQNSLTDRIAALEKIITDKDKQIEELRERVGHLETEMAKVGATKCLQ